MLPDTEISRQGAEMRMRMQSWGCRRPASGEQTCKQWLTMFRSWHYFGLYNLVERAYLQLRIFEKPHFWTTCNSRDDCALPAEQINWRQSLVSKDPYSKDRNRSKGFWKLSNIAYMSAGDSGVGVWQNWWCYCEQTTIHLSTLSSPGGGGRGVKLSDGSYSDSRSETGDTSAANPGQVFTLFACLSNQTRILTLLRSSQSFHNFYSGYVACIWKMYVS